MLKKIHQIESKLLNFQGSRYNRIKNFRALHVQLSLSPLTMRMVSTPLTRGGGAFDPSRGRGNWFHTGQIPTLSPWGGTRGNTLIGVLWFLSDFMHPDFWFGMILRCNFFYRSYSLSSFPPLIRTLQKVQWLCTRQWHSIANISRSVQVPRAPIVIL